jgi:hypothetical protein
LRPRVFGDKFLEKPSGFAAARVKEKRITLERKMKELVAFAKILAIVNQN